jgi:hypothetical protein
MKTFVKTAYIPVEIRVYLKRYRYTNLLGKNAAFLPFNYTHGHPGAVNETAVFIARSTR